MRLSKKWRGWLSVLGTVVVPLVVGMSGVQGFWPILAVCTVAILWTFYLFWDEISRIRVLKDPDAEPNDGRPFWLILPGIAMLLIASYPFVLLYQAAVRHIEPLTFNDLLQTYIHDRSLYVSDLARTSAVVRGKTFENVRFVGPAIILFVGDTNFLTGCSFGTERGDQELVLLEVPPGKGTIGGIGFEGCVFRNCIFERIQVMGTKIQIDKLRKDFAD